jgi:ribosome maturation protein SDO1
MVTVEKAIIAKLEKEKQRFEILVDAEMAYDLRSGKSISIQNMLAVNQVFTDARKGDKAGPAELQKAFGTTDAVKIAEQIVKAGDIQLTTDFRRKKVEEKRKAIATLISRVGIDPRTRTPHPPERILNAMEQTHVNIDAFKPPEQQMDEALKAIKPVLPISIEEIEITAEIPAQFSGGVYRAIREYGQHSEQWVGDKLVIKIKIPAGLKDKFYSQLAGLTKGEVRITEKK